ncbi:EF-hand [Xylona heveae TC161]|uniref:EF-hand n=1 Tax=Xylona heveae (strain CBS 132557 / TC161) TaxID=1328760 RepID=A0A165II68_XYLHT|nr:EF-hand [Xylona heveae TC161]KZF24934.1 EF-hand [Xylona heveae TC161]
MASSSSFPLRASNLGKLPERTPAAQFAMSTSTSAAAAAQQQRERERERERLEREGANGLAELTEEQREEITEAFGLFDLDKDKHIDYHELKVAMKALGFDLPKPEILQILQTYGIPADTVHPPSSTAANKPAAIPAPSSGAGGPGSSYPAHPTRLLISLPTFQIIMAQRILARDPREEILRAFDLFDEGGKGKISLQDLRRVARELGEGLEEEELAAMIEEFDLDGDGAINRDEFLAICMQ